MGVAVALCSSLTQPGAAVSEVRQCPETCLEGGQALTTLTSGEQVPSPAGVGVQGAGGGSQGPPPQQSHTALGKSLLLLKPVSSSQKQDHSFIPSMLM